MCHIITIRRAFIWLYTVLCQISIFFIKIHKIIYRQLPVILVTFTYDI